MNVAMNGINENVVTFEAVTTGDTAVAMGGMVKLCGNGKVCAVAAAGDTPIGVVCGIRGDYAAVQITGYVKMPCAANLTVGWHHLAINSSKQVAEVSGGRCALVTDVSSGVCGAIL